MATSRLAPLLFMIFVLAESPSSPRRRYASRTPPRRLLMNRTERKKLLDTNGDGVIQAEECVCSGDSEAQQYPEIKSTDIDYSRLKEFEAIAITLAASVSAIPGNLDTAEEVSFLKTILWQDPVRVSGVWLAYLPDAYGVAFNKSFNMSHSVSRLSEQGCGWDGSCAEPHPQTHLTEWYFPQLGRNATLHSSFIFADSCCLPVSFGDHVGGFEWAWAYNYVNALEDFHFYTVPIRDYLFGNKNDLKAGQWSAPYIDPVAGILISYVVPIVSTTPIPGSIDPWLETRQEPIKSWENFYVMGTAGLDIRLTDVILDCVAGEYSDFPKCYKCPMGKYRRSDQAAEHCSDCPVGRFGDMEGASECGFCPAGSVTGEEGQSKCRDCDGGHFAAERGMSSCIPCAKGEFLPEREEGGMPARECKPCPVNSYTDQEASQKCTLCNEGFVTAAPGMSSKRSCICSKGSFGEPGRGTCVQCGSPWKTTAKDGSSDASDCEWDLAFWLLIGGLGMFVVCAALFGVAAFRFKKKQERRVEELLVEKLMLGIDAVSSLQHSLVLMPAALFLKLTLESLRGLHEVQRNNGNLIYLDTVESVNMFKARGFFIVFFSYQWLSWKISGPDHVQHKAMQQSVRSVCEHIQRDVSQVYIWLDIISIPQYNFTLKTLAVNSLYTFARQADALVIVAPASEHVNLCQPADVQTYKSRVWTRAEQVSFFCNSGLDQMFIMTDVFTAAPKDWMDDVAALFEGSMTCCSRKHEAGGRCDKESLVLPMLGMYFDLCMSHQEGNVGRSKEVIYSIVQQQKSRMFPETHDYATKHGSSIEKLFGNSIVRLDRLVAEKKKQMRAIRSKSSSRQIVADSGSVVVPCRAASMKPQSMRFSTWV